ncbi:hypothetical protein C7974DRAFT_387436 [Boeremia exigua]|uniref:uncharacterized protein n=1 Tax=Boeremia exigua TaxID=749465 RepID=UPI001E8E529C|nr:uncharacterized protein C7974DRAFT_387436 [Boeremia exigua]KAH6638856.1 hypothetical protein C7974DRAFT_387436 [Boeremia exigua]
MALPRTSLSTFLTHAKQTLRTALRTNTPVTLVIGNTSADLDSMSSAILYAYVRSAAPPRTAFTPLYIPVTNMRAAGLAARPEFLAVFKSAGVEGGQLITLDDLPALEGVGDVLEPRNTAWVLVDHNVLVGELGRVYGGRVRGVIDHHEEEGGVPRDTGEEPRVVEKSGSCSSLVVGYVRAAWEGLGGGEEAARWDAEVAQLGLASVLIDTANLQDGSKTTDHDRRAVEYLEGKIRACPQVAAGYDRTAFYEAIDAAKQDIGSLRLRDILQKDYKEWEQSDGQKLGISSVVKPIPFLLDKAGEEAGSAASDAFLGQLRSFAEERGLDLYSIMTTSTSPTGAFQRELLLWALSEKAAAWAEAFAAASREELGLEDWDGDADVARSSGNGRWRRVWWQRQVQHSRKRVAPLLRQAHD